MYVVGQEEIDALARVIRSGALFRYGVDGECDRFEKRYAKYLGCRHFALAASGSNALAAAMIGVGLGPGDEVLIQRIPTWRRRHRCSRSARSGHRRHRRDDHHRSGRGRGGHRITPRRSWCCSNMRRRSLVANLGVGTLAITMTVLVHTIGLIALSSAIVLVVDWSGLER